MAVESPIKVLHVEFGGSYGGSLRALELYLRHSDPGRFVHDVLFFYPTPKMDRLRGVARRVDSLHADATHPFFPPGVLPRFGTKDFRESLSDAWDWLRLWLPSRTVRHIARRIRDEKYDVVHVNNTFAWKEATIIAAKRQGVPVMAHVRNPISGTRFARQLLRWTDLVVTVSSVFEKEILSWTVPASVRTCYDGMEPPVSDSEAAAAVRRSLLPAGGTLIGSAGRLDKQKGYHDLIRAARIVVDSQPGVRFVVAGDGPLRGSLQALIDSLGLREQFLLCGFREDVPNFLAALDLFVSSSYWEGLPLVVLEAMLLGKPVVATDVGGTCEVVIPGRTGMLVPSRDPGALASTILLAIRDPKPGWAQEARRLAATISDPERSARVLDDLTQNLTRKPQVLNNGRDGG